MAYNGSDYYAPPFTNGVMTLTHEECVEIIAACQTIIEDFEPSPEMPEPTENYIISTYNRIDWKKGINGDTYEALLQYDVETMSEGIAPVEETENVISE